MCGEAEPSSLEDDGRKRGRSSRRLLDASDNEMSVVLSDDPVSPPSSLMRLGIANGSEGEFEAINSPFRMPLRRVRACEARC